MSKLAYLDAFSGVSGDMFVAALLDAGLEVDALRRCIGAMQLPGVSVSVEKVRKAGFSATRFVVHGGEHEHHHRGLSDILKLIAAADLPAPVKRTASDSFKRLGRAEAEVHGVPVEQIHFHEVGAVDSIVDVVAAAAGLHLLGIARLICSPLPVGSGTIQCAHGTMPIPAPATANLLKGVPIAASAETGELTTPTGAAIVTATAESFGPVPAMTVEQVGYGAGRREGERIPNLLRVMIGQAAERASRQETDTVWVLEANLDDAPGELVGHVSERLLAAGALDVFLVPIYMKKNRPAVMISVIVDEAHRAAAEQLLFAETTTFGLRRHRCQRSKLNRQTVSVRTPWGTVNLKIGRREGKIVSVCPEFEDCRTLCQTHDVPLKDVMAAALAAYRKPDP